MKGEEGGGEERRGGGERREIRRISQRWKCKLSLFIPPLSYCCGRTGKTSSSVPVSVYCHSIHLLLVYCPSHIRRLRNNSPAILCCPACSRMSLFALCAHHECLDRVQREHRVNVLKKREWVWRERERAQLTAHGRHRLGLCTGTLWRSKGKSPPSVSLN